MRDHLRDVFDTADGHQVPVIVAGDIFHTWDNPAELVNFAIEEFSGRKVYAVPGQHDLPNHNYEDVAKSSYWTLVRAGVIEDMEPGFAYTYEASSTKHPNAHRVRLWPFPWGYAPEHPEKTGRDWDKGADMHVAVVHRYIWSDKDTSYPGAPEDRHVHSYSLDPYSAAVFGDNHLGFSLRYRRGKDKWGTMFNCGGFIRRNIDQRTYDPAFGVLFSDGRIERVPNRGADNDKWVDQSIVQTLKELTEAGSPQAKVEAVQEFIASAKEFLFNFRGVVEGFLRTSAVGKEVRKILEEAIR